jgi:hypothetical protein
MRLLLLQAPCQLDLVRDNSKGLVVGPPAEWAFIPPQNCTGVEAGRHGEARAAAMPLVTQRPGPATRAAPEPALQKLGVKKPAVSLYAIMCPCAGLAPRQQWNISTLGGASFVTSPLASSGGDASYMAVFSDHDPHHAVEGNAVTMWYGVKPGHLQSEAQWVVKPDTKQLMWASPETGGAKKGGSLCLTTFPRSSDEVDAHVPKAGDPLGVWPCSEGNSTKYPNWQTFVPAVSGSTPIYSLPSVGDLCVTWDADASGTC